MINIKPIINFCLKNFNKVYSFVKILKLKIDNNVLKFRVTPSRVEKILMLSKSFQMLDLSYYCGNFFIMQKFLSLIPIKKRLYKSEAYDCDDFSYDVWRISKNIFKCVSIGVAHVTLKNGQKHAINFFIYDNNKVKNVAFFEPQTGYIIPNDFKSIDFMII